MKQKSVDMQTGPMTFKSYQIKNPYSINYTFDVFKNLLTRVLENIEANRAVLVLPDNGSMKIEAEAVRTSNSITTKSKYQLKNQENQKELLPESVLKTVLKKEISLTIDNPVQNGKYASDPYFIQTQVSFVFCSPVCSGTSIEGLLYLESRNKLQLDKNERSRLLALWADQATLSMENTKWFSLLQEDLKNRIHEISAVKKENKARIQFLADMNHEVMSPLNSIVGFSELLMKKDHQLHFPPEVKRYLENIQSSGNKLVELLDNVLEYSRLDSGSVELVKENIDLRTLFNSVYLSSRQLLNSNGVSLQIVVSEQCPHNVFSDRSLLTKILMTLIRFAIQRSNNNIPIVLSAEEVEGYLRISLSDNGPPFSLEEQQNLFSAFVHKKQEIDHRAVDTDDNLALATSKQMIDRLQGTIEYIVSEDKQADIVIKFPCRNAEAVTDIMAKWRTDNRFSGEYRVILLEDQLSNWDLLYNILKDLGLKTKVMPVSPNPLLELVESDPHLMFIDMHMPGMDDKAKTFIRQLRTAKELRHIPLIALTTDKYHCKYQSDYRSIGVEFLVKPFGVGDIVKVVRRFQNELLNSDLPVSDSASKTRLINSAKVLNKRSEQERVLNQSILKELEELTRIPIYKGGTIINRLNKIKEEYRDLTPECPGLIGNLKSAVFEGDGERFVTIIKKAIENNR